MITKTMTVTLNQWMKLVGLILPDRYLQIERLWDFEVRRFWDLTAYPLSEVSHDLALP